MDVPPPAAPPPPAHAPPAAAEGSTSGTPHAQLQGAAAASSSTPKLPCNVGSSRRTKTKILTKDGRKVAADLEANVRARWLVEQLVLACAEPRSRRCEDNRLELWLLRNPATGKLLAPGVNVAQAGEQRRQRIHKRGKDRSGALDTVGHEIEFLMNEVMKLNDLMNEVMKLNSSVQKAARRVWTRKASQSTADIALRECTVNKH